MRKYGRQIGAILMGAALLCGCGATGTERLETTQASEKMMQSSVQQAAVQAGQSKTQSVKKENQTAAPQSAASAKETEEVTVSAMQAGTRTSAEEERFLKAKTADYSGRGTVEFDREKLDGMFPVLTALAYSDYQLNRSYDATDLSYVGTAVYSVLNGYTALQQEARGIVPNESGGLRVPAQAVQEIANAMFLSAPDMANAFQSGNNSRLRYDSGWEAFDIMPADGESFWCQLVSDDVSGNGSWTVELSLMHTNGDREETLGYAEAVLVKNTDAEFISDPEYYYTVAGFRCDINGRDVAIGYPEK